MELKIFVTRTLKVCVVVALLVPPVVSSAQDNGQVGLQTDPPPGITAPPDPGRGKLAPGVRVRFRTDDIVEVPGLGRAERVVVHGEKRLVSDGRDLTIDEENQTLTVSDASGQRVTLPKPRATFVGQIMVVDDDTLVIRLDGRPVRLTVPRSSVTEMDVSLGRSKKLGRGASALRGLGIGVGGGVLLGYLSGDDHCTPHGRDFIEVAVSCWGASSGGEKATIAGTLFGVLGGIIGAAWGGGETDRWEGVERAGSSKAKVAVRPQGRMGLSVSIAF